MHDNIDVNLEDSNIALFKEKKYPIDFDLLKKNSQYFFEIESNSAMSVQLCF